MKRRYAFLIAFVLFSLAVSPALAQGPYDRDPAYWNPWPFGTLDGVLFGFAHSILTAFAVAALGALVVVLMPRQARQVSETALKSALPSLGVGCLTVAFALPLFVLLVVLIVTIPAALILPLALTMAWLFGWIALGWSIGERVMAAFNTGPTWKSPMVAVVAGILLLSVIAAAPIIGWLLGVGVGLIGLGAVILTRFGTQAYPTTTLVVTGQ